MNRSPQGAPRCTPPTPPKTGHHPRFGVGPACRSARSGTHVPFRRQWRNNAPYRLGRLLERQNGLTFTVVLDDAVLRRAVGGSVAPLLLVGVPKAGGHDGGGEEIPAAFLFGLHPASIAVRFRLESERAVPGSCSAAAALLRRR